MPKRPLVCALLFALPLVGQPPTKDPAAEIEAARRALARSQAEHGADHQDVAYALTVLGQLLRRQGRSPEAEPLIRRALAIEEKLFGVDHPETASSVTNVAVVLYDQRRFEQAERFFRRLVAIRESQHGADHPDVTVSLNLLAAVLRSQERYRAAETLVRRALAICEKRLRADHPNIAWLAHDLAGVLRDQGRYGEAEPLLRRALAIREERHGADHHETVTSVNNLALVLQEQGRYREAEPLLRRALAAREKQLGADHPGTAASLSNLAALLNAEGRSREAEPLYRRALAICENGLGRDHLETAVSLDNLAALLGDQGRYQDAEPLCRRALAIHEKQLGADHPRTARSLSNLAVLLGDQGRSNEAEPLARRALAIREKVLGADHPLTATSSSILAGVYRDQGRYAAAEPLARRTLATREQRLGPDHPLTAESLNSLAALLGDQDRHAGSEPLLRRALAIQERQLGADHPAIAMTLSNLAETLRKEGRHREAEPLFSRALAILDKQLGADHPNTTTPVSSVLYMRADSGDAAGAFAAGEKLCDRGLDWAVRELAMSPGVRRFAVAGSLRWKLDLLLSSLPSCDDAGTRLDAVYRRVCAWKGLVFRHVVRLGQALGTERADAATQTLRSRLRELKSMLGKLAYARQIRDVTAHREQFEKLRAERREVEMELLGKLGIEVEREATDAAELARLLPERTAVLDFTLHEPRRRAEMRDGAVIRPGRWDSTRVVCWITVHGAERVRLVDLGEALPLIDAVEAYLDKIAPSLRGARRRGGGADPAVRLRELLWTPLAAHLTGVTRLLVIPEGAIGLLPFGAIEIAKGRYLLEVADVVYVQDAVTLRDRLAGDAHERTPNNSVLCLGAVDYERRRAAPDAAGDAPVDAASTRGVRGFERNWPPLSQTGVEVDALIGLHRQLSPGAGKPAVLRGADATEEATKRAVAGRAVLHLATHGFFEREGIASLWESALAQNGSAAIGIGGALDERPRVKPLEGVEPGLLAGLILAGANQPAPEGRDDGVLTAAEVAALPLSSCELAVLSACETALGTGRSGEGLQSMRRPFHEAGAKTVVSSLWKVDDKVTRQLMSAFYRRVWKGVPVADALRAARLELLANKATSAPKFWAAFTLSGEWR